MRIVLGLEYAGQNFCGWQSQPSGCGVQDVLQRAVAVIAGHPVTVNAAGRTDTGVHAAFQVAHFDTDSTRPITAWVRGVNSHLPAGVAVLWAREIDADFHSRFLAFERGYRYVLVNHPVRPALAAGQIGWHHRPLDEARMNIAAQAILGRHDFSAFRAAECQARSPVKELRAISIERRGDTLLCDFVADGFLHHMVRNLMGSLVHVGVGNAPPEWLLELRASRDRTRAAPTFMPDGLYLNRIRYPRRYDLPETSTRWPYA